MSQETSHITNTSPFSNAIPLASIRKCAKQYGGEYRWSKEALEILQGEAERHMVHVFTHAGRAAEHAGRKGVRVEDIRLQHT